VRPFADWPQPFKPLNEPIRTLVGQYEAGLHRDRNHSRSTLLWMCEDIEGFFYDHPRAKRPEQILITDVEDWRIAKQNDAAPNCVRRALCALKAFYAWMARELPEYSMLDNPVWIPPVAAKNPRPDRGVTAQHPDFVPTE
jgi:site-specific recombinase XerD